MPKTQKFSPVRSEQSSALTCVPLIPVGSLRFDVQEQEVPEQFWVKTKFFYYSFTEGGVKVCILPHFTTYFHHLFARMKEMEPKQKSKGFGQNLCVTAIAQLLRERSSSNYRSHRLMSKRRASENYYITHRSMKRTPCQKWIVLVVKNEETRDLEEKWGRWMIQRQL